MTDESSLREALKGSDKVWIELIELAAGWPHEETVLPNSETIGGAITQANYCRRCQLEAALASQPSGVGGTHEAGESDNEHVDRLVDIFEKTLASEASCKVCGGCLYWLAVAAIQNISSLPSVGPQQSLAIASARLDEAKEWECFTKSHASGDNDHYDPDCFACERLGELTAEVNRLSVPAYAPQPPASSRPARGTEVLSGHNSGPSQSSATASDKFERLVSDVCNAAAFFTMEYNDALERGEHLPYGVDSKIRPILTAAIAEDQQSSELVEKPASPGSEREGK